MKVAVFFILFRIVLLLTIILLVEAAFFSTFFGKKFVGEFILDLLVKLVPYSSRW